MKKEAEIKRGVKSVVAAFDIDLSQKGRWVKNNCHKLSIMGRGKALGSGHPTQDFRSYIG